MYRSITLNSSLQGDTFSLPPWWWSWKCELMKSWQMGCEKPEGCPFCLAWWPTSVSCAVRGPSSGWLLPLGLGPEPMNVNIPAQPTVDNQIQMVCAWGTGTQHLYFGWVQSDDRWVSVRRNALSLAVTQQSQLLFLWSYFEPILNIFFTPSSDMKETFFSYFLYIFLSCSRQVSSFL